MSDRQWLSMTHARRKVAADDAPRVMDVTEHLLQSALYAQSSDAYQRELVRELAGEFGGVAAGWVAGPAPWQTVASHGRWPTERLPTTLFAEVLDRDEAVEAPWGESADSIWAAVPVRCSGFPPAVFAILLRRSLSERLAAFAALVPALTLGWQVCDRSSRSEQRRDRLQRTLKLACELIDQVETESLLKLIAEEATKLLDCDRVSIFLWDREHQELIACPALGVEGGVLRLPDRGGIVGEVIHTGRMLRVDDAYADPRFNQAVDRESGYRTESLLCCPLIDAAGKVVGAIEGINHRGGPFTPDDEQTATDLSLPVAVAVRNTRERESLMRSHRQLTERVTRGVQLIGDSAPIVALRGTVQRLASTDLPVLILGESGTGKEVVAQSLHFQGPRADRPFVAVNCAALTETLLESELFGHEAGSFTDARELRRGQFELAEGGTIFLDEIGDMSLNGQAKLLRVLEQKVIARVGGSQPIPISARVIAATNANLAEAVRARRFREDLYFRLNVVTLDLPPLRNRPDDILPLAEHFLKLFTGNARRARLQLSPDAKRRLQQHSWPGNVRELRNLMERVAYLTTGEKVEADDLAFILSPDREAALEPSENLGLSDATNHFQQDFIRRAIKRVRGNMSEAARLLGLHRSNLYRKMRQLGMSEAGDDESAFV
jgi:Nif-specific regulatory protein